VSRPTLISIAASLLLAWLALHASPVAAQQDRGGDDLGAALATIAPELNARLIGLERAQGVLLGAFVAGKGRVDESDVLARMTRRLSDTAATARADPEADKGFAALGAHAAEIIRRAHAFHREVAAVFAGVPPADRRQALDAAIRKYRSRPDSALPDAPKDMTILYDHPYTSFVPPKPPDTEPLRVLAYPKLTGFEWSAHWYELAVLEPLGDLDDRLERDRALATVAERFQRKLTGGTGLDAFPTELPLAPAIAPGLVALHERAASIVDNLDIMLDVISDVLVHPEVADRRAAVNEVLAQFMNRQYRCVQTDEWIVVALRHSIFDQGGFALHTMSGYERNAFFGGHGQHYAVRRAPPPCDPE
jgi:hypothetical protein